MTDYDKALETYFTLKQAYEQKYMTKKARIIKDGDLSKREKRKKIRAIKLPCVGCHKKVGTIFEDKDRQYVAMCGDPKAPCDFKIVIQKSTTLNLIELRDQMIKANTDNEFDIIKMKLALLFGFVDEESLSILFQELKEKYKENTEQLDLIDKFLTENLDLVQRKENIKELNVEFYETVKSIKLMMSEYLATKNPGLVKDAVEILTDTLDDILFNLRENKYRDMFMETNEDGNRVLIQRENGPSDLEFIMTDGEVLEFTGV
jgi:hypothetical protein